ARLSCFVWQRVKEGDLFRVVVFRCATRDRPQGNDNRSQNAPDRAEMGAGTQGIRAAVGECAMCPEFLERLPVRTSRLRKCCIYAEGDQGGKARRDLARHAREVSCSPLVWGSP